MFRLILATCLLAPQLFAQTPEQAAAIQQIETKLEQIIIPAVEFSETPLFTALTQLSTLSAELDQQNGIKTDFSLDDTKLQTPISLSLTNIPLGEAISQVVKQAKVKYKVESHAVIILTPAITPYQPLIVRTFTVAVKQFYPPPPPPLVDPFAPTRKAQPEPRTAKGKLENAGITFPVGATAIYNPETSTLIVKNTQDQLELIEAYVESITSDIAKQIIITSGPEK